MTHMVGTFTLDQATEGVSLSDDVHNQILGDGSDSPHVRVAQARNALIAGLMVRAIAKGMPLDVAANLLTQGVVETH